MKNLIILLVLIFPSLSQSQNNLIVSEESGDNCPFIEYANYALRTDLLNDTIVSLLNNSIKHPYNCSFEYVILDSIGENLFQNTAYFYDRKLRNSVQYFNEKVFLDICILNDSTYLIENRKIFKNELDNELNENLRFEDFKDKDEDFNQDLVDLNNYEKNSSVIYCYADISNGGLSYNEWSMLFLIINKIEKIHFKKRDFIAHKLYDKNFIDLPIETAKGIVLIDPVCVILNFNLPCKEIKPPFNNNDLQLNGNE